jgi:succinate dehydrogenase/fumarate reductase flavoprotein subunit
MGGLWVDYNLMSTIPGLHVLGEANFSDHGANRLGASALMQGLSDGYFVLPYTIGNYLAGIKPGTRIKEDHPAAKEAAARATARVNGLFASKGKRTPTESCFTVITTDIMSQMKHTMKTMRNFTMTMILSNMKILRFHLSAHIDIHILDNVKEIDSQVRDILEVNLMDHIMDLQEVLQEDINKDLNKDHHMDLMDPTDHIMGHHKVNNQDHLQDHLQPKLLLSQKKTGKQT